MNETIDIQRRSFIKESIMLAGSFPFYGWSGEREEETLCVVRNGKSHTIPFLRNGVLEENGYYDLCRIFGDMRANVAVQMDPNLFLVLARAQKWLQSNKIHRPIILTSGYRTQHTNEHTEGAARNSMHLYGKAADIRIEGLPSDYLARLMRMSGGAGIGIYPNFVHVDTWKERAWLG